MKPIQKHVLHGGAASRTRDYLHASTTVVGHFFSPCETPRRTIPLHNPRLRRVSIGGGQRKPTLEATDTAELGAARRGMGVAGIPRRGRSPSGTRTREAGGAAGGRPSLLKEALCQS
jgi:hypothetical protein